MKTYLITILCLLFSWMTVTAQDANRPISTIRANGEAVITVKPDRAQIDIGVVTQAATSQETVEQNSRQIDAVVTALRKLLGANADIKTINYGLTPKYRYLTQPPTEPVITGYTAVNSLRIVISDLNQLSKVIDTAGTAGANQIQSLQFMVGNQQAAQAQALNEAALSARRKADQLASAIGARVIRILSLTDTTPIQTVPGGGQFLSFFAGSRDGSGATIPSNISSPAVIAPRTIDVRATVTIALEIAP